MRRTMCHFTSRSCVRPLPIPVKGCKVRMPHTVSLYRAFVRSTLDPANPCEGLQGAYGDASLYLAFVHLTTPIPVKGCKVAPHNVSLYLAFVRSTLRNPCEGLQSCVWHTLSLYLAFVRFDPANPCEGLHSAYAQCVTLSRVRAFDHCGSL